jgi:hypothetical protein
MDMIEGKPAKRVARIFEEVTGLFHVCDDALDYLDARGTAYRTKADALRAAAVAGYTHATGSGCTWRGIRRIPARYTVGRFQVDFRECHVASQARRNCRRRVSYHHSGAIHHFPR